MLTRKDILVLAIKIVVEQTFVVLLGVGNTLIAEYIGKEAEMTIIMYYESLFLTL